MYDASCNPILSLSLSLSICYTCKNLTKPYILYHQLLRFPGVPSSSLGFSPEMMHPQLQLSQPGLIQGGAAGMANPDVFRRIMQAQLSAKDGSQVSIYSVYTYDSTGPSAVFLTSSYEHTGVHQNLRRY